MKKKERAVASVIAAATALLLALVLAPVASAADLELRFVGGQPQDAEVDATIRTADLNTGSSFVQIEVIDLATETRVTNFSKPIGFVLNPADGFATGNVLDVEPQVPVNGVATFGEGTLSIDTENEPQFTDYSLIPVTTKGQSITGPASDGFDVWEDGESCTGSSLDPCEAKLVPGSGSDTYTLANVAGSLGASELFDVLDGLVCPGQRLIFDGQVFSYATTESDGNPNTPVQLVSHITKRDWKASANNGQAHADWCIGLQDPWTAVGGPAVQRDTDGIGGPDLYVGLAPKCPSQNPSASAPCIVSQNSDGSGGSITIGWLPGGDPPRRT